MYAMEKDHFKVTYDRVDDICYIELSVDEETKNHNEVDSNIDSPFVPEIKDSKYCPVTSYLTYIMCLSRYVPYLRCKGMEVVMLGSPSVVV